MSLAFSYLIFLFIAISTALAIWAGYTIYKRNTAKKAKQDITADPPIHQSDSKNDSLKTFSQPVQINDQINSSGKTKFVLETARQPRALERFSRLKTFQWDVQLEMIDSLNYKIFMLLPVNPTDTSRVLDSLSMLNGRRVHIEH